MIMGSNLTKTFGFLSNKTNLTIFKQGGVDCPGSNPIFVQNKVVLKCPQYLESVMRIRTEISSQNGSIVPSLAANVPFNSISATL